MSALTSKKRLLVFHSAYTFRDLKTRGLEVFVTARDAGKVFDTVLTVNAVASLQYPGAEAETCAPPEFHQLDPRNVILEGRIRRFSLLSKLKFLDFFFAQISIIKAIVLHGRLSEVTLIRAEDPRFNGLYGYFFSRVLRKPLVVGVWGNPARIREDSKSPLMPRLFKSIRAEERVENFVLRRADMVLAQNEENMSYVLDHGVDLNRTLILPLGIGIDACHFAERDNRLDVREDFKQLKVDGKYLIVCVSRLENIKLVDHAIRSCSGLENSKIDFQLLLIGDGRDRDLLAKLANDLGMADRVKFAGNRSQEWIAGALVLADLAIAPLTGRALLEIALAGCPVAAFDVDWHKEIVRSGETGELVEFLNDEALGDAIVHIIENDKLRHHYGEKIRTLALEMAQPAKLAAKQAEIYRLLIGRN